MDFDWKSSGWILVTNACETTSTPCESASISACMANKFFHQIAENSATHHIFHCGTTFRNAGYIFWGLIEIVATGRWLSFWVFAQRFTQKRENNHLYFVLKKKGPMSIPKILHRLCRVLRYFSGVHFPVRSDLDKFLRIRLWVAKVHEECVLFDLLGSFGLVRTPPSNEKQKMMKQLTKKDQTHEIGDPSSFGMFRFLLFACFAFRFCQHSCLEHARRLLDGIPGRLKVYCRFNGWVFMELLMKISMEWMQHVYWPQNQARLSHPWANKVTIDNFFDRNFGGAPAF